MQKIKYITNRDLLAEIKNCKASYCHFVSPQYVTYDVIVAGTSSITPELVAETVIMKANKLSTKAAVVDPATIAPDSLVFRVMTDSHLPPPGDKNKRRETKSGEMIKANFAPFRHYILRNDELIEVGRSHWLGDFETGGFSVVHGKINNRLASMFMLLVEQYSRRGNWRGYCMREDHEVLTQRGFLGIDEMNETDKVLCWDQEKLVWGGVKSIYRDYFDGQLFHLSVRGMEAFVTPGHKFVTAKGIKPVEYLVETDRVILMGDAAADGDGDYEDAFVELVGWAATEGNWYLAEERTYHRVSIYQNDGVKADRIRACLTALNVKFSEYVRSCEDQSSNVNFRFLLTKDISQRLDAVVADRVLSMPFLLALSAAQRELLINTIIDGDGTRVKPYGRDNGGYMRYCQKDKRHVDAFLALCTMNGHRTTTRIRENTPNELVANGGDYYSINIYSKTNDRHKVSSVENIDFDGGKRSGRDFPGRGKEYHPNVPTYDFKGRVWCPETEYGTMIARCNGTIYVTHNTYNDEMRSHALVQLSQVGLQFDESRSDNPFAFYTQIIKNCLSFDTKILTREHGVVAIGEVAEQDVTLLDGNQHWVKCHIYDHGEQETIRLNFCGNFEKISIRSTSEHDWILDTDERLPTKSFVENNGYNTKELLIADLRPSNAVVDATIYRQGVIHGLIYGDGSAAPNCRNFYFMRVCQPKIELASWFGDYPFTYSEKHAGDPTYYLSQIKTNLKALPEIPGENLDFLRGFLRGWLGTDGCVSKAGDVTICGDIAEYHWLRQWAPLIGWHIGDHPTPLAEETNFGKRIKLSHNIHIKKRSVCAEDFLRTQHRDRWTTNEFKHEKGWKVYPISQNRQDYARQMERVYCPVVETTGSFALASGIHSSNCFRRILNLERRSQEIRDDLLIMSGAMPSYTRQVENEIDQREDFVEAPKAAKRGRKPKSAVT